MIRTSGTLEDYSIKIPKSYLLGIFLLMMYEKRFVRIELL